MNHLTIDNFKVAQEPPCKPPGYRKLLLFHFILQLILIL